jgi:hypothetical protein
MVEHKDLATKKRKKKREVERTTGKGAKIMVVRAINTPVSVDLFTLAKMRIRKLK